MGPGLSPGAQIEKYRVVRRIGEGGMATIYLVSSIGPGGFKKRCALKLLKPPFSEKGDIADLLIHEARVASRLQHPHIVQVFDLGTHGSGHYMTMEWIDGLSLASLLQRLAGAGQRLPIGLVAFIGRCVAEALGYLRRGVEIDGQLVSLVHRDVTPSNVLVSTDGLVKLTDFGIVKLLETPTETKVGVVKGKYAYMSPEQIRGEAVDHRSDIFALGVVLFESLTGRRLFNRKTLAGTVAAVHAAKVFPPSALNDAVPPDLDRLVLRALARNRADRFVDAEEVAQELEVWETPGAQRQLGQLVEIYQTVEPTKASADGDGHTERLPSVGFEEFAELESLDSEGELAFPPSGSEASLAGAGSTGSISGSAANGVQVVSISAGAGLDGKPWESAMRPAHVRTPAEGTSQDSSPALVMEDGQASSAPMPFGPATLPILFFVLSTLATLALWIAYADV